MTRPNTEQLEALREITNRLDGIVESIDVTSSRALITLRDGGALGPTLRIGWRPVGLELSVHEPGEDPDHAGPLLRPGVDVAEDFDALRRGYHAPELSPEAWGGLEMPASPAVTYCSDPACGHVKGVHRQRGPGAAYCTGIHDDPHAPGTIPCRCNGWTEPEE